MKIADPFYKSKQWHRIRQKCLMRAGKRCEECGAEGKLHVHHVKPRKEYPMLELDMMNLVVLCTSCHNRKHDRKNNSIIEKVEIGDDGFAVGSEWG